MPFTVLCFGDVVGAPGRAGLASAIPSLKARYDPDFILVNGENIAGGSGVTAATVRKILSLGVDVVTTGDHFFRNKEFAGALGEARLLRPANYPASAPGRGWGLYEARGGVQVGVLNLMGRIFMEPLRCPFETADEALAQLGAQSRLILVDMHAEATSEKCALGWFLDGRVSAVVGTHTHIQTADERVLPKGTAYITDLGMTGPYDSIIGRTKEPVLQRLRTGVPARFTVAEGDIRACGAAIRLDPQTGRALSIERFQVSAPAAKDAEAAKGEQERNGDPLPGSADARTAGEPCP